MGSHGEAHTMTADTSRPASGERASKDSKARRICYFDWLRGAAALAVVALHMFNKVLTDHPASQLGMPLVITWTELQLVFTRWAVPVFLMISGALLLNPEKQLGWDKIGRYVRRMFLVLLLFCPVYTCMSARAVSLAIIMEGVGKALTQSSWDHLWYVYALIGLYLLTPLFATFVRASTQADQAALLAVLAIATLVIPTLNFAQGTNLATFVWVSSSVFYYLLGSYAHRYLKLNGSLTVAGLGSLALAMVGVVIAALTQGRYPKWLIRPECPLVALWALFVFLLAKRHLLHRPAPRALALCSDLSLAIYLIHPLPLIVLYRRLWWMPYQQLPPVLFELVVLAVVYGISIPVAYGLKKVPGLRSIL